MTERIHTEPEHGFTTHDVDDHATVTPAYDEPVVHRRYIESLPARVNAVLFTVLLALEGLLALRFLLLAFGANLANDFVDFVMDLSWPFVRPFSDAFANRAWDEGIIEVSTLLAMGVYLLAFLLVAMLVTALLPRFYSTHDDAGAGHTGRVIHG
jgi:hypothetical protein